MITTISESVNNAYELREQTKHTLLQLPRVNYLLFIGAGGRRLYVILPSKKVKIPILYNFSLKSDRESNTTCNIRGGKAEKARESGHNHRSVEETGKSDAQYDSRRRRLTRNTREYAKKSIEQIRRKVRNERNSSAHHPNVVDPAGAPSVSWDDDDDENNNNNNSDTVFLKIERAAAKRARRVQVHHNVPAARRACATVVELAERVSHLINGRPRQVQAHGAAQYSAQAVFQLDRSRLLFVATNAATSAERPVRAAYRRHFRLFRVGLTVVFGLRHILLLLQSVHGPRGRRQVVRLAARLHGRCGGRVRRTFAV